ncbi:unnamed protein product, partial [Rotaria socialis]
IRSSCQNISIHSCSKRHKDRSSSSTNIQPIF